MLGSKLTFYGCQVLDVEKFFPTSIFVCTGKEDASFVALFLHSPVTRACFFALRWESSLTSKYLNTSVTVFSFLPCSY